MEEREQLLDSPAVQEKVFTIGPSHNLLVISLQNHSWVAVSTAEQEVIKAHTPNKTITLSLPPGAYTIHSDGVIENVTSAVDNTPTVSPFGVAQPAMLRLTSDAPDQHIIDGVGEIAADGTSFCTITIDTVTLDTTPLTGQAQQSEVFLRTTGGVLLDAAGENRIRSVTLQAGRAAFRLVSEASPKVVTVSAFGQGPALLKAEIQIEFV